MEPALPAPHSSVENKARSEKSERESWLLVLLSGTQISDPADVEVAWFVLSRLRRVEPTGA